MTKYEFDIVDILGVDQMSFSIHTGAVARVEGANASGKTSVAVACQALLAQLINPLGVPVSLARSVYQRDDATADPPKATVVVSRDDGVYVGEVAWIPRSQQIIADLPGAVSNRIAVGLVDFARRGGNKEKSAALQSVLLPPLEHILEQVRKRLEPVLLDADLEGTLRTVTERGWEAAHGVYVDRNREAKRSWENIAGRRYGVNVAADWRPEGWLADYDLLTVAEAQALVTDARDALTALHEIRAVSQADADRAERSAAALPEARERLSELDDAAERAKSDRQGVCATLG